MTRTLLLQYQYVLSKGINFFLYSGIFLGFLGAHLSCKKFVQVDPPVDQLVSASVFSDDVSATSAITGIYSRIMENPGFLSLDMSLYGGLSADDAIDYSSDPNQTEFYANSLRPTNSNIENIWQQGYQYIYQANSVIEGLSASTTISQSIKQQLLGEAKFVRAFCHFYLTNLFGAIPLTTSTNYQLNAVASRTSQAKVYDQIVNDLLDAEKLLPDEYISPDKTRPNKSTASALLARVYLYNGDWVDAENEATAVIENHTYYLESDLDNVFLKKNNESIWQLAPVSTAGINTWEGNIFILEGDPSSGIYGSALSAQMMSSFENGDQRKVHWIGIVNANGTDYYFPYKYKVKSGFEITEMYTVLRLAEQYIIRAEARSMQNKIAEAQDDLNIIRRRAGLSDTNANDKNSLINAITQERRVEFFSEWGHRWLDLKRTGHADEVLSQIKINTWKSTDTLYPIPNSQIQNDPNMDQNQGY